MKSLLKQLLDQLDSIYEQDDDLTDTEVREAMFRAVARGFIFQKRDYTVPPRFGLYKRPAANGLVRTALNEFISAANAAAEREGLATPEQRLAAFQDESVVSDQEHASYWYFGSVDDLTQLSDWR